MKKNGFTLIELLIVIAIIGSLVAVVVGALSAGRDKAFDTKIKSNLGNMRTQAALYFTENGSYGDEIADGACDEGMFLDAIMVNALTGVDEANGEDIAVCYTNDSYGGVVSNTWAVSSPLRSDTDTSWCVDSNGYSEIGEAQIDGDDNAICL